MTVVVCCGAKSLKARCCCRLRGAAHTDDSAQARQHERVSFEGDQAQAGERLDAAERAFLGCGEWCHETSHIVNLIGTGRRIEAVQKAGMADIMKKPSQRP